MLRFFRHIRQRLFLEGKVSRYIGYAVGEIVLIFIGITMALAANAWWENKQLRKEESSILSQILITLESDLESLQLRLERVEEKSKGINDLLEHIEARKGFHPGLVEQFSMLGSFERIVINSASFEDLKNRGLKLVSEPDLRLQLIQFFENNRTIWMDRVALDVDQRIDFVQPYMRTHFKWRGTPIDYEQLLGDYEFLYILKHQAGVYRQNTLPIFQEGVAAAKSLIEALKKELNR